MRTVEEHQAAVSDLLAPLQEESLPLAAAHGRVLARDVPGDADLEETSDVTVVTLLLGRDAAGAV